MFVENVLVRPLGENTASIYWTSETETMRSWVFIKGRFSIGPFMAETRERNVTLTLDAVGVVSLPEGCFLKTAGPMPWCRTAPRRPW